MPDNHKLTGHVGQRRLAFDGRPTEQSRRLLAHRDERVIARMRKDVMLGFKERQASVQEIPVLIGNERKVAAVEPSVVRIGSERLIAAVVSEPVQCMFVASRI